MKTFAILLARASSETSCMSGPLMKGESDISLYLKTAVVLGLKYRKVGTYGMGVLQCLVIIYYGFFVKEIFDCTGKWVYWLQDLWQHWKEMVVLCKMISLFNLKGGGWNIANHDLTSVE